MIKLRSLLTESNPWEMSSAERKNFRPYPEKAYRHGRPMAYSFDYVAVEPQVVDIVATLHRLGIATSQSAGFADSHVSLGAMPNTGVGFEQGKISPQTLEKIKKYLEGVAKNVQVYDGNISFTYEFPTKQKLSTIDAQAPGNAQPAKVIWSGVVDILTQDLPN